MPNQVLDLPCTVRKVRFERDMFSICEMGTMSNDIPQDACINLLTYEEIGEMRFVALGDGLNTKVGANVLLSGAWEENKKFGGLQLHATDCRDNIGHGKEAIVAYLSSGFIKGIGKKTAALIYDQFGEDCISIIQDDPQMLLKVRGIKHTKLKKIVESYEANQDYHALARLLMPLGLTPLAVKNIAKELGKGAAGIVRRNPYELCNVRGFSFPKADTLARSLGTFEQSDFRIAGGIIYTLDNAQSEGHLYLNRDNLCHLACSKDVLNSPSAASTISPSQVDVVLTSMLKEGKVKTIAVTGDAPDVGKQRIYKSNAFDWEMTAASALCTLLKKGKPRKTKKEWESIVRKAEEALGFSLDNTQREAAVTALSSPVSIITGGPGTGKTSSLRVLVTSYMTAYPDADIALAAPTGRAARRMAEQIGMEASTLHSFLHLRPNERTDFSLVCADGYQIEADLLVIDESSMIDAELMANLMYRMTPKTQLLFLGDSDQLPSVGPGNVLRQLLECPAIPNTRLTRIFRQKEDSLIPYNAASIRQGLSGLVYSKKDFFLQKMENEKQALSFIKTLMKRSVDIGISSDVQILCPMRKRGAASTVSINEALRDIMNPPAPSKAEIEIGGKRFRVGDKVMQTKNIEGAANGDIGFITKIKAPSEKVVDSDAVEDSDEAEEDESVLSVQFYPDEPEVRYSKEDAFFLDPATAITIHKSQGSEFKKVIIPLFRSMSFFLKRNLLYTAVTRAREQVILVSDESSIAKAIGTEDTSRRNTALSKVVFDEIQKSATMDALGGIDAI